LFEEQKETRLSTYQNFSNISLVLGVIPQHHVALIFIGFNIFEAGANEINK
jgi:hypothetical protein